MSRLTGLAPDPRQTGYYLVEVDRGRFASLPADALAILGLAVGEEIPPRVLDRLQELADIEAAFRAASRTLANRGRARGDLRRRLLQKQHPPIAVDQALSRLEQRGLLDDGRFAVDYAARRASRGRGPARIVADLLAQGVGRGLAESAVRDAFAQEGLDPARTLRVVAARRAAQLADLDPAVRRRRLHSYLVRRGYPASEVRDVMREMTASQS